MRTECVDHKNSIPVGTHMDNPGNVPSTWPVIRYWTHDTECVSSDCMKYVQSVIGGTVLL